MFRRPTLIALLSLALLPGAAQASTSTDIHKECQDGKISGSYSSAELSAALRSIPTDLDEYTDCRDVIRRAQLGGAGGGKSSGANSNSGAGAAAGGGSTGGGAAPGVTATAGGTAKDILSAATPAEQAAVNKAIETPATAVRVGNETISPDAAGLSPAGAANVVPTPLVVALLLLGLGLAFGGFTSIRNLVLARRTPAT